MATPFPRLPMLAIAIGLVSHSYALTSLFPYAGYMMQHLGVTDDKDEAGYYAGYVASAFMIGRFGSSYFWGRFADSYGRLPVMYVSLTSMAVLSIAFGLSTSLSWALGCRFVLGAMNGLLAISKTMTSEVCGKEHEAVGLAYTLGCASFGLVIGPGLGGLLAEPATHVPAVFSETGLFGRFPYLLPNIFGASLALTGLPFVFFFLKETRHLHNGRGDSRGEFVPISSPEVGAFELHESDAEEGRTLEMIPSTRTNQELEKGNDGSGEDVRLEERFVQSSRTDGGSGDFAIRNGTAEDIDNGGDDGGDGRGGGDSDEENHRLLSTRSADGRSLNVGVEAIPVGAREGCDNTRGSVCRNIRCLGHSEKVKRFVEDGGGGGNRRHRRSACWRECLVPIRLLRERRIRNVMVVYAVFSFITIGSRELYPLWALSTVASGGLDWTSKQIGQALSTCGVGMLFFQLLVYPRLAKQIGVTRSQRWACIFSIPVFLVFPMLSRLRDSGRALAMASLALLFLTNVVANTVFINLSLATNNAVDPSRRATLNGLSMTTGSLAKAAGPMFFSSIFAWSVDGQHRPFPLDYHLAFYLLALGMVVVSWASWDTVISPKAIGSKAAASALAASAEEPTQKSKTKNTKVLQQEKPHLGNA